MVYYYQLHGNISAIILVVFMNSCGLFFATPLPLANLNMRDNVREKWITGIN